MSSQSRTREEERRLNIRTLVFASIGSAAAAVITSQFWIAGTPIAAAMTPVIVALVSELLHRPTEKMAQKFTTETDALPEAAGAGPPPRSEARHPEPPARDVTIYTSSSKRQLPWRTILLTGALAFVIAAAVLTLPELIAGQSLGRGDGSTSLFNRDRDRNRDNGGTEEQQPAEQQQTVTETVPAEPPPDRTVTQTTPAKPPTTTAPQRTTPTTPSAPKTPVP